jgi:hypothetical protein
MAVPRSTDVLGEVWRDGRMGQAKRCSVRRGRRLEAIPLFDAEPSERGAEGAEKWFYGGPSFRTLPLCRALGERLPWAANGKWIIGCPPLLCVRNGETLDQLDFPHFTRRGRVSRRIALAGKREFSRAGRKKKIRRRPKNTPDSDDFFAY